MVQLDKLGEKPEGLAPQQPRRVYSVDGIIAAVGIEVEALWVGEIRRTHAQRIDLRESSLPTVIMSVDGIVQLRLLTSLVAGKPPRARLCLTKQPAY